MWLCTSRDAHLSHSPFSPTGDFCLWKSQLCGGGTVKNEGEADKKITKSLEEIVDFRSYENSIFSASLMIIYCF